DAPSEFAAWAKDAWADLAGLDVFPRAMNIRGRNAAGLCVLASSEEAFRAAQAAWNGGGGREMGAPARVSYAAVVQGCLSEDTVERLRSDGFDVRTVRSSLRACATGC
ncbi:unnamed protein product, partial [Prorocentrum cordatum]